MKGLINRNLKNLSDAEFDSRALHVVNSMTDNSHFPLLQDRLAAIKTAEQKFTADLAAAKTLGRQAVAVKNQSRAVLAGLLNSLALLIMAQTDDVVMLVTTGFVLRKKNEPRVLLAPTSIKLSAGMNSGEIASFVNKPRGAESFLHQICEAEGTERMWTSTATTSNKHLFTNLQPGKLYAVRSAAVGSKGQLAFSPIATMYAQ